MATTTEFRKTVSEMWRERILNGAAQVFSEKGFNKATTKEIAEVSGVGEGTIYNHFKNKRGLLFALLEKIATQPVTKILLDNPPNDPAIFFKLVIEDRIQYFQAYKGLLASIMAEVFSDPELRHELNQQIFKPISDLLEQHLQQQIDLGVFRPISPMVVSNSIIGVVWLNIIFKSTNLDPRYENISQDKLSCELIDLVLKGLYATEEETRS